MYLLESCSIIVEVSNTRNDTLVHTVYSQDMYLPELYISYHIRTKVAS